MLKKGFLFFFLLFNLSSESTFRKSLHSYIGLSKFFRQSAGTEIEYKSVNNDEKKSNKDDNDDESQEQVKALANGEFNNHIKQALVLIHDPESKEDNVKTLVEILNNNKEKICKKYGFVFSIYLGEFMDIISFGICFANENYTEDIITYNPKTKKMLNAKPSKDEQTEEKNESNGKKNKSKKKKKEDDDQANQEGSLFLKRKIPLMIGGFVQIQNDDLDSFFVAGRVDLMVGLLKVFGQSKELFSFVNKNLINTNSLLLKNTIIISLSVSLVLRLFDLEVAITTGVKWAPIGIKATQTGFSKEQIEQEDYDSSTEINIKTNHLEFFIAISLGFSF
ncbi:hypothetical protein [Alphaproteobacteria bacterium endosymbiont of Tiliacea citrago]|uniref:hypothetical protein n=1 Tax=Alphaproteobacteria bacterium endosymbiont of Tiliacea citrago TaxID=3077944 RepID=UPI00313BD382